MTIFGPYSSGSEFSEVHDRLMGKDEYDDLTIHPSELETSTYRKFHRKLATSATVTNLRIGLTLLVVSLLLNGLQAIALLRLHKATHFDESTKAYSKYAAIWHNIDMTTSCDYRELSLNL